MKIRLNGCKNTITSTKYYNFYFGLFLMLKKNQINETLSFELGPKRNVEFLLDHLTIFWPSKHFHFDGNSKFVFSEKLSLALYPIQPSDSPIEQYCFMSHQLIGPTVHLGFFLCFQTYKKGMSKKSIFASPDNVTGRVGIGTCGVAGKGMTDYQQAEKYKK